MTEAKKGNIYIVSEMILWSLFPVLGILGFNGLPFVVSLFWVNLLATIFFFVLMSIRGKWAELKNLLVWKYTLGVVLFICVLFYGFYFYGLQSTVPANASIVALFEVVPTYIFFQMIRKEHFDSKHIIGIILGVIGVLIVLLPKSDGFRYGDLIILCATIFPPIGNFYQQKVRKIASAETILLLRHALTLPFLLLVMYIMGASVSFQAIKPVFGWILINGIVVFGISKILWVEGIHRMSVTRAIAISGLNPIFTVLFAWLLIHQLPTASQLFALPFLIVSILILTNFKFKKEILISNAV